MLVPATTVPVTIIGAFAAMAALGFTVNLVDAVRHRAVDRHRRRRRHRRGGRRGAPDGEGHVGARCGDPGDERAVRADHRHHAGAGGGLRAGLFPAGADRAHVCAIRAGDRRHRAALGASMPRRSSRRSPPLWLRPPVPPEQRNFFYRGFNAIYARLENAYARLIGRMVGRAGSSAWSVALIIAGSSCYGLSRVPTGFLPIEDQGYLLATVQLPDGASLSRTQQSLDEVAAIARKEPASRMSSPSPGSRPSTTAPRWPMPASPIWCSSWWSRARETCFSFIRAWRQPSMPLDSARVAGGAAAADPGHRQCRRLHHAGRAARRQQ